MKLKNKTGYNSGSVTSIYAIKDGVSFHNTLGHCSGFHDNISVKAWKRFGLCTQILFGTMAICDANTIVETFPLQLLSHIQGYYGNYCNTMSQGAIFIPAKITPHF